MKKIALLASAILAVASVSAHAATSISNAPTGGSIGSFGAPNTRTYGQVFTAPITGTMTSFTMYLDGSVGNIFGGVGTWNGTAAHGLGFGSPVNLFQSADVASVAGANIFAPNISVTAGQRYVAYLSAFGVAGVTGATSMPLGNNSNVFIDYFVWNNTSDPRNNASWNYFANFGNANFAASFSVDPGVPEPATWALLMAGFGMVGGAMRRRQTIRVTYA